MAQQPAEMIRQPPEMLRQPAEMARQYCRTIFFGGLFIYFINLVDILNINPVYYGKSTKPNPRKRKYPETEPVPFRR
jgi:hypothetical protein